MKKYDIKKKGNEITIKKSEEQKFQENIDHIIDRVMNSPIVKRMLEKKVKNEQKQ